MSGVMMKSYEGVIDVLQCRNAELIKRVAELERERDSLGSDRDQWRMRADTAEAKFAEQKAAAAKDSAGACFLEDKYEDLEQALAEAQQERDAARANYIDLEQQLQVVQRDHGIALVDLKAMEEQCDAARAKAEEMEESVISLRGQRDQSTRETEEARCHVAKLQKQMTEKNVKLFDTIRERDKAVAKASLAEKERDEAKATVGSIQEDYSELESERNRLNRRVQELEDDQPDGLSAILRELREERIYGAIEFDKYGMNAIIKCIGDFDHSRSCETYEDVAANLTRLAIQYHPDSSFARRRAEATVEPVDPIAEMLTKYPRPWTYDEDERHTTDANGKAIRHVLVKGAEFLAKGIVAAVNAYQPPQPETSLSQETLVAIDRAVGTAIFQYTSGLMESLKKMDKEESAPPTPASPTPEPRLNAQQRAQPSINPADASGRYPLSGAVPVKPTPAAADPVRELLEKYPGDWEANDLSAICELVNRYRAIESAVNGSSFVRETIMSNLGGSTWESLHAALRPLLRTSEKEA